LTAQQVHKRPPGKLDAHAHALLPAVAVAQQHRKAGTGVLLVSGADPAHHILVVKIVGLFPPGPLLPGLEQKLQTLHWLDTVVGNAVLVPIKDAGGAVLPQENQRISQWLEPLLNPGLKRLSRLVKSMLDLSRIDSGEMKIHPRSFDITHTSVATLLTFEQKINEKQIEIHGLEEAAPVTVYGDQDLLHQVVYNLVENAVKFTNQGGAIKVLTADSIDRTTVMIENTGPGIASEDLPMVFDRFYKGDKSRSRDKNGMGLGLYLVRTILKLHGGDIHVSSVQGEFCRFEFTIPKPPEAPKLKETAPRTKEPRIRENKRKQEKAEKHEKRDRPEKRGRHDTEGQAPERSKDDDGHGN